MDLTMRWWFGWLLPTTVADHPLGVGGCSTDEKRPHVLAVEILGRVGSALLVYSVLQTRE
jgi:hypothetical protein